MAIIDVDVKAMLSSAQDFGYKAKDIRSIAESITAIYNNLNLGSAATSRDVARQLIVIEAGILEQAVKAENLGKALEYIANQYNKTEGNIIGILSGTTSGLRETISHFLKNTYLKILKILGLDEKYYNRQMGYEEYRVDKTQEKLMDQYLSDTCANLLQQPQYSKEAWKNATEDERKNILSNFIVDINEIMGTNVNRRVNFVSLKNQDGSDNTTTRGQYSSSTNSVTINTNYLGRSDSYQIMQTMIHEMRHCYQHTAVEHPEQFMVSGETLEKWRYNFSHYKDADTYGYDSYVQQPIEWDAKNFAKQKGDVKGRTPEYAGSW